MNIADGKVIGTCMKKHRHQEWIRFLNLIRRSTPARQEIHLICDNYATHKHEKDRFLAGSSGMSQSLLYHAFGVREGYEYQKTD